MYFFTWPAPPSLPTSWFNYGGGTPLLPQHPHHQCVSVHYHLPTWASHVSVPEYRCLLSRTYCSLYMLPPSNHPSLPSRLPDSCHCRTLAATKISSTVTLISYSYVFCLHCGTQSLPPPLYPVSSTYILKIGRVATHYTTVACHLSKYILSMCFPAPYSTDYDGTCHQYLSLNCIACLSVTCLKKLTIYGIFVLFIEHSIFRTAEKKRDFGSRFRTF